MAIDLTSITSGDGSQGFVLQGERAGDYLGNSVASAGDVNGDGFADLIVGARLADGPADGRSDAGGSYVIFGKSGGFDATVDLASITSGDGSQGFVLQGEREADLSGASVASAGDVNGDGFDDLIVSAPLADGPVDGRSGAGDSYVIFGKAGGFGATIDLAGITSGDGSRGFVLQVERAGDYSGNSVASAGDVNGDGFADLIVGAPNADGPADGRDYAGDSYVIFGKAGGFGATIDLASIAAGTGGFVLQGESAYDRSGQSVASAGDINGDGFDDLIVGAPYADGPVDGRSGAGDSYVIFGSATIGGSASAVTNAGTAAAETLNGTGAVNVMVGGRGDDILNGNGGADSLRGGEGDDRLAIGDAGFLSLAGGTGDDVLALAGAMTLGDAAFRRIEGIESIALGNFATSLTLGRSAALALNGLAADGFRLGVDGASVANAAITVDGSGFTHALTINLSGNTAASTLTGGVGDDVFTGGSGNDTLNGGLGADRLLGGTGADTMTGGGGDDIYYVDNAGDQVVEAAAGGSDNVHTTIDDTLAAGLEVEFLRVRGSAGLTLTGNELNDYLIGGSGGDTLNGGLGADRLLGGTGADTMTGGGGDDFYYVDNAGDQVVETVGGGADNVYTGIDYTLAAGLEVEFLRVRGSSGLTLTGNELDDYLIGGSGGDTLNGGLGADRLDGRAGADTMAGGGGDDIYYVDNAGDQVVEAAAGGNDNVYASVDYALAAGQEVEFLRVYGSSGLTLTGNELADYLIGGASGDTLNGGLGNDRLDGRAGADTMTGGGGNDIYYVDNAGDQVVEAAAGGSDNVFTSVDYTLAAGMEVEFLRVYGSSGLTLTGNELADYLIGGSGGDTLNGGLGADRLLGGGGADTFVFAALTGSGTTASTRDTIRDFVQGADLIDLAGIDAVSGGSDDAFSFIGGSAFSGAAGELRQSAAGANTLLSGDVNGDTMADFTILLTGSHVLLGSDFVL